MPRIFVDGDTVYITWEDSPGWVLVASSCDSARMAGTVDEANCAGWRPVAEVAEEIAQAIEAARGDEADKLVASKLPGHWTRDSALKQAAWIARDYAVKEG